MFEVRCEQCQNPFEVDERRIPRGGLQMRCPQCNASTLVKRPVGNPPPPPPRGAAGGAGRPPPPRADDDGLPLPMDPDAALPLPKDPNAALPLPRGGEALRGVAAGSMPEGVQFDFDLPSPAASLPVSLDVGLPAVSGTGLPAVSGTGLPAPSGVGLPKARDEESAVARAAADARSAQPEVEIVMGSASDDDPDFGVMRELIGLDGDDASLSVAAENLPASVDLPASAEGLPSTIDLDPAGPGGSGPEASAAPTKDGLRLGRIGLERKAFTVTDDLPTVSPGAALPSVVGGGRRRAIEEEVVTSPRKAPAVAAAAAVVAASTPAPREQRAPAGPAPVENFGDLDLGPMTFESPSAFEASSPFGGPATPPPSSDLRSPPPDTSFDAAPRTLAPSSTAAMSAPPDEDILGSFDRGGPAGSAVAAPVTAPAPTPERVPDPTSASSERKAPAASPESVARRRRLTRGLYVALGVFGVVIIGGAALALTPLGAFGTNFIDEALHGDERLAAANRVIQEVERTLEQDTHERALAGLRRLDQVAAGVPQVKDLQAYIVYANNLVAARFGPEPARIGRARQVLATLGDAPPATRFLSLARASDALQRGDARDALRLVGPDPAGRDLATLAAERLGNAEQLRRLAREGRQRHPTPRSRYLLARASAAQGDVETARQEAESVLRGEPRHAGARLLLSRLLMRQESERERALELVRELIGGRGAAANPLGASVSERAEACVVAGQIELHRDRVTAAQARFQRALELDPRSAAALVGIGQILLRQDNPADAVARFRNALSAERGNLDATIGVAEASLALGQAGDARQVIEPAVRATPGDGRLHYWLGRSLAATSDQRTLAQQSFREAIRLQPTSLDAYVALAEMLLSMQRNDQADQVLMEARARVPESSAIHRALAHSRLVRGDLAGAEGDLRLALQRDPQDIRAHLALGDVLRRMQRLEDARRALDAVTELDPAFPGLAMARGQLAEARGELPQALQTFREALARDPTNVDLIVRVATTLVSLGNFNDADQMLRSVVADHASNAEAQFVLGRARLGAENFVDAVHHLDRAIELNPSRADYKAYSAEAHRRAGDLMRALQLAEQSIELDPTFPRGYWVRAEIRLHRGDAATALVDINRATQLDPRFWAAYATWADIDDALGRRAEAIRLYRLAIEREGSHGDWQYSFGRLLADAGDQGAARTAFTRARSLGGNATPPASWFVQATRALADIERDRGSRAEAQRLYTEYLRLVPAGSAAYNSAALALSDMLNQ